MNTDLEYPYFLTAEWNGQFIGQKVNNPDEIHAFMTFAFEKFGAADNENVGFEGFPMALFRPEFA